MYVRLGKMQKAEIKRRRTRESLKIAPVTDCVIVAASFFFKHISPWQGPTKCAVKGGGRTTVQTTLGITNLTDD